MITHWDIVSNLNAADASIAYTLLIDGTEADARLMAKKLQGYVQAAQPATPPYAYRFALPADMDEDTLAKIKVAVHEALEQSKKINEFTPDGAVGNPLFQADNTPEENKFPTFITLDPEDTFSTKKEAIPPVPPPDITATLPPAEASAAPEPVQIVQQSVQADELPDQLVAENTPQQNPDLLTPDKQPTDQVVDDIFLAETKYDMFVDVNKLTDNAAKKPVQPENNSATNDEDVFNIFDQKVKDQTAFIDLADISDITERITKKDLNFVKHAEFPNQPQNATPAFTPSVSQEENGPEEALDPFEQLLAQSKPQAATPAAPVVSTDTPTQAPASTPATPPLPAKPAPITENHMTTENKGEPKTFIHLKHKAQPIPPAPVPPAAPVAPQAPTAPTAPQVTAAPQAPAQTAQPNSPLHRRRATANTTFLDKTHTIDHSIEIPLSELQQQNWSLEVPLIPTYTLENMTISINRFAHATAISVIENPGKMYNPLVLHGTSGTGKTHFLHAIGYALSKKYGQENIFVTNGVRLSRGIQRYITEGKMQEFEDFTSKMKALFIDDIHLISINEQNRVHLSKLLNDFRAQNKQIVITSKYPPENLAKLEELLKFRLDSGWISDLKPANGSARMRIIMQMLSNNGLDISNTDANRFFGHPNISLGAVARSIRRVHVLEKLIFPNQQKLDANSTLTIFDQLLATKGEDQSSLISQKSPNEIHSVSIEGKGEWGRIGFFYPQHNSNMMNWLLFALQQRAKELGIRGGLELAVRSSYTTDNIISSAFKIANLCDNKKLKGAIILGPSLDVCEPSVRDNFYDILMHMLEIMMIRCGMLNLEDISAPSTYVQILSELLR